MRNHVLSQDGERPRGKQRSLGRLFPVSPNSLSSEGIGWNVINSFYAFASQLRPPTGWRWGRAIVTVALYMGVLVIGVNFLDACITMRP